MCRRPVRSSAASFRALLFVSVTLFLVSGQPAAAKDSAAGYNSKAGGGKGQGFSGAEEQKIKDALDKIAGLTIAIKGGAEYSGADIAKDLRKMLRDGRMGKGVGADKDVYGATQRDDKETTDGDRMNIADHFIKDCDNKNLGNTLVHEWLHTKQKDKSKAEREAPAYQVGKAAYLLKGGANTDAPYKDDSEQEDDFKKLIAAATPKLPDSNAPAHGSDKRRSGCGHEYYMEQSPGRLYVWKNDVRQDSVVALPNQVYFDMINVHLPGGCDRLLVFGSNLTNPLNPVGTLTVVDADLGGFVGRSDSNLPGFKYPFSVDRDTTTGQFYCLDAHFAGNGVWKLLDLNADGVPDVSLPFAPHGFPGVDSALALKWAVHPVYGGGLMLPDRDTRGSDEFAAGDSADFVFDSDLNGSADSNQRVAELELADFAPTITCLVQAGMSRIEVMGVGGHQLQVFASDSTGAVVLEILSLTTIGATGVPEGFQLSRPLAAGEYIIAGDLTSFTQSAAATLVEVAVPAASTGVLLALAALLGLAGILALVRRAADSSA